MPSGLAYDDLPTLSFPACAAGVTCGLEDLLDDNENGVDHNEEKYGSPNTLKLVRT